MKTKIIYISGNEIFNIADIRTAFEEVRTALQLDKDTVLFGVPVDTDDAGFGTSTTSELQETETIETPTEKQEPVIETFEQIEPETVVTDIKQPKQKRGRSKKKSEPDTDDTVAEITTTEEAEKIVPILSVLSGEDEEPTDVVEEKTEITEEIITEQTPSETSESEENKKENDIITEIDEEPETENFGEPDLEKLLSAMTPLQEDSLEDKQVIKEVSAITEDNQSEDVDATLEQLATEFAETQDKIATEAKSSSRSKIGKLRNILPFKQSKHQDQGLGDLFGWAGVAANDEEFSVPGFFTNASSKK